jgi:hypothetical protein
MDADLAADHSVTLAAKMLRLELLKTKAELERGLAEFSLTCTDCGRNVHRVSGLGNAAGHWSHAEPASHGNQLCNPSAGPDRTGGGTSGQSGDLGFAEGDGAEVVDGRATGPN